MQVSTKDFQQHEFEELIEENDNWVSWDQIDKIRYTFLVSCASNVGTLLSHPFYVLTTRQQVQLSGDNIIHNSNIKSSLKKGLIDTYSKIGFKGLFRGYIPLALLNTPSSLAYLGVTEYTRQTYEVKDGDYAAKGRLDQRPGEVVVVALLNGGESEGIILGSINHPYRSETLKRNNEVAYVSEFNGIEEYIAKDGEWRLTYRGIQKNIADLRKAPDGNALPHPEYDNEIGTGYMEWDKTGSFFVTDNASDKLPQSLHINKKDGKIVITSGKTELTIDKKKESYSIKNKEFTIESLDKFSLKTKKTKIESTDLIEIISKETKIKSKIFQEGDIKIKGKVESEGDFKLKGKIDHDGDTKHSGNVSIGANLESSGMTKLSGGAKPLITDIIMIMGTGNLGMPVMSTATILTTTKTKAT